jgi:hypothetical protein
VVYGTSQTEIGGTGHQAGTAAWCQRDGIGCCSRASLRQDVRQFRRQHVSGCADEAEVVQAAIGIAQAKH